MVLARPDSHELIEQLIDIAPRLGTDGVALHQVVATRLGIGVTDLRCLEALLGLKAASIGELGERVGLTSGAATRMIDRLEGAGFVERRQDPDDRRRVIVVPLEDRLADIAPLYEGIASGWRALLERATEPQLEFLVEFLDGVHHLTREQIDQLLEKG